MATLITKAKEIIVGVWNGDTMPTSGMSLTRVIADTLSVTQDDADTQEFEFETTDTKETFYTAGSYQVELNNAEISEDYLTQIMGWIKTTNPEGVVAPGTYESRYVALQVKFSDSFYLFLPKISIAPKLVFESIKTNLAYGTLSGTATNSTIDDKVTSIGIFKTAQLTVAAETSTKE
jgi:hypothetical protein